MKKIMMSLVALVSAIVLADPIDSMSKKKVEELDNTNWGDKDYLLTPETAKFTTAFLNQIYAIIAYLEASRDRKALSLPENSDSTLDRLVSALKVKMVTTKGKFNEQKMPGVDDKVILGNRRANMIDYMSELIGETANKDLCQLVDYVLTYQVVRLHDRWSFCFKVADTMKMSEKFKIIDAGWLKFKNSIDTMNLRRIKTISGSELLMTSGLNKFVRSDLTLNPAFAWLVRVTDRQNEVFSAQAMFYSRIKKLKDTLPGIIEKLGKEYDDYQERAVWVHPNDRPAFDKYFKLWSIFLDDLGKLVDDSWKMINDSSWAATEVGMLRKCRTNNDFSPAGAFAILGEANPNGMPNYQRRIQAILDDCRKRYIQHCENRRKWYPDDNLPVRWE
jgi:hypothetical protein